MPVWDDFINSLKGAAKGIAQLPGALIGNIASSGAQLGAAQTFKGDPRAAAAAGIAAEMGTQKSLQKAGIATVDTTIAKAIDPVLYTAQKAEEYVFSPIIARPISTAFLLTDPSSRLYQADEYGKGFQFSDVIDAYERSEKVSLGVSLLKSNLTPLGAFQSLILKNGGIDVNNVDLWDDEQIKKNFEENTLGKWITGTNDFLIKNVAINVAGVGLAAGVRASALKAGLNTRFRAGDVNAMPEAEDLINQHIAFRKSGGTEGNFTVFGEDVEKLARTTNDIEIKKIIKNHSNNPRIVNLIKDTESPEIVRDFILADKGYAPAIERLAAAGMRDDLWVLGDGNLVIQGNYASTGQLPKVTPENSSRVFGAFDDAIKKNPKHQEIYDAFLKEVKDPNTGVVSTEPTFFGKNYKPAEPVIGSKVFGAVRSRKQDIGLAVTQRDFSNVGGYTQTVLQSKYLNGPSTVLIRTFGTMMPKGFITNSGVRPQNGIDELIATFDDIPLFTRGDKMIINHENIPMTVSQYRLEVIDKFVSAKTDGERAAMINNLNTELARTVAFTRGFTDTNLIDSFVTNLMQDVYSVHGNLRQMGTTLDPTGVRIQVAPQVQAQLANSMPVLPFGELDRMLARAASRQKNKITGGVQTIAGGGRDAMRTIFELGNKAFSISALYRFSYIPKNSIFEPLLSGTMAGGTKFATTMFGPAAKQIIKNNVNVVMRGIDKSKTILPSAKTEIQRELKGLSEQYNIAINNRDIVYAKYEQLFADVPGVSPATKREWADVVKEDLRAAEKMVDFLETKLNKYTVEYGKPIDVPSLYNLKRRVETLKSVGKEAEAKSATTTFDEVLEKNPNITETGKDTMALVKTDFVKKFMEFDRTARGYAVPGYSAETIAKITADLKSGKGFTDPLIFAYFVDDTGKLFLKLTEGNHRLQAALNANLDSIPVKIVRGFKDEANLKPVGVVSKIQPDRMGYIPGNLNPKDILPSTAFVKAKISEEANLAARYASEIRNAEVLIAKASQTINTMAPEINTLDVAIASAYKKINDSLQELGPAIRKRGEIFSVAEGRYQKKPLLPEVEKITLANGQVIEMPSMRNQNYLGDGYFSEIANNNTRAIEVLGNKATVAKFNTIFRNGPQSITNVADPLYFDELAYVVNNFMRGDMLVDQVLAGIPRERILAWAASNQGASYARSMGRPIDQLTDMVDEAFSYVNRYLPTKDAQLLASAGPVKKTDLEQLLADKLDQMVGIQPLDVPYANPTNLVKSANEAIDSAMAKAWRGLVFPENAIREVYGTIDFAKRMTEKANMLVAQGQEVTLATILSMRQAVAAEMVENISKTFYTIPRQQRGLYLARALTTFPNAAASGIYRYGGFAVKQPGRMGGFLNSYYGLYNSFGVDKYGNPVENPMEAEYLLIPGTKEMGLNDGKGVIVSSRATNFIANLPSGSYLVPLAIGRVLSWKVSTEDEIKKTIDKTVGRIPGYSYDELFPYGIETDLKTQVGRTFTPAWARNLATALNKSTTDEMWVNSLLSEAQRQQVLHEMKLGPKPTEESIRKGTASIYLRKFRTQMFSLLGTPQYVESRPDALFSDYYYMLYDKYKAKTDPKTGKPLTEMQASNLAEDEFQKQMRLAGGADFPMDRLFTGGARDKVAYFPPSQKAYSRIYEDFSGLAKKLERLDPSLVGLMTADLPRDYNIQVSKFLNDPNATLPGGTILNSQLKTPQMAEDELTKSRLWKAYTGFKDDLNSAAKKAGYSSYLSVPELKDQLRGYAETLGEVSPEWFIEYGGGKAAKDTAFTQSAGLKTILKDTDFMKKFGNTQFWTHAKAFIEYRDSFGKARLDAPSGYKSKLEEAWQLYLEESLSLWDPTLQRIITRYYSNDSLNIKEPKQ
jgi:hypothetical protein